MYPHVKNASIPVGVVSVWNVSLLTNLDTHRNLVCDAPYWSADTDYKHYNIQSEKHNVNSIVFFIVYTLTMANKNAMVEYINNMSPNVVLIPVCMHS